jgi:hypothetical protein
LSPGNNGWPKLGRFGTSPRVALADNFCVELNAPSASPPHFITTQASTESETNMFYLIAILLVMVSPLAVPVAASIAHSVNNWRRSVAGARPVFSPAIRGALPAAA